MSYIRETADGIVLKVYVQPRASSNMIAGIHGDALKIKLTAPPVEGEANKQCIGFLAKLLGLPKSNLDILSGTGSRNKQIRVRPKSSHGEKSDLDALKAKIESLL